MQASYAHWVQLRYNGALTANQSADRIPDPAQAQDASARDVKRRTNDLFSEVVRLREYWERHFDDLAKKLAEQALDDWYKHNARAWRGTLKRAGFDIEMQLTQAQKLILRAKVAENVALIKSIQQQYHADVEGAVMRAFTAGRDLDALSSELVARYDVTKRRAAFIARDQANKATADMNAARQRELGLQYAVWIHSAAGKEPRKNHVRAGREQWVFDTQRGIDFHDGFGHVLPGQAINCRCVSRSIIPALGRGDIEGPQDLDSISGFPGAYRAKPGKSVGPKPKVDVTKTRLPGEPVRYS